MVPRALLGARRVVFASANPLVSVTGNSSPAAAFFVFSPCPHYLRLPTTPSVAALLLGRLPGRLQCPREWSQVVLLRPVPRLAPTVREGRHRHIFPRRPGLYFRPSLCCRSFCAPAATPQFRLHRCAAPTAQHQTDTIRETGGYLKKTTRSSREFFSRPSTRNTLQLSRGLSASFVLPQLKRIRFFQRKPLGALENFFQPPA